MTNIESDFITRAKLIGATDFVAKIENAVRRLQFTASPDKTLRLYVAAVTNIVRDEPFKWAMISPQFEALATEQPQWRKEFDLCCWAAGDEA